MIHHHFWKAARAFRRNNSNRFSAIAKPSRPGQSRMVDGMLRPPASKTSFGFGIKPAARERPQLLSAETRSNRNPAAPVPAGRSQLPGNARDSSSGRTRNKPWHLADRDPSAERAIGQFCKGTGFWKPAGPIAKIAGSFRGSSTLRPRSIIHHQFAAGAVVFGLRFARLRMRQQDRETCWSRIYRSRSTSPNRRPSGSWRRKRTRWTGPADTASATAAGPSRSMLRMVSAVGLASNFT